MDSVETHSSLSKHLQHLPSNHPSRRWLSGKTPFFASTFDQRFSFALHVPRSHSFRGPTLPLLVVIHGTRRQTSGYINKLQDFSDKHECIILCPLFPAGIIDPSDIHNYKTILYKDIRFDLVLLSMIDQAAAIWRIKTDRFFLHGFSGGGQFAHRFMYLHPERLAAVSIGAPGHITPPATDKPWPAGLADLSGVFGISDAPNFDAMARIPVQLVVGENDLDTSSIMKNTNDAESEAGGTRVDRIKWLKKAFEKRGIASDLVIVPNVGHEGMKCLPAVEAWFTARVQELHSGFGSRT